MAKALHDCHTAASPVLSSGLARISQDPALSNIPLFSPQLFVHLSEELFSSEIRTT